LGGKSRYHGPRDGETRDSWARGTRRDGGKIKDDDTSPALIAIAARESRESERSNPRKKKNREEESKRWLEIRGAGLTTTPHIPLPPAPQHTP
jgi:hypothetical protein